MNNKVSMALEKALQDKAKGNYHKALQRINETLEKHPGEVELFLEGADVCLEGGESLQATHFLKKALAKFAGEKDRIDAFAREKLRTLGDPVLAKFLLDQAIKRRDLEWASEVLDDLQDRSIRELLQRTRTKKQTLSSAARGGHALISEMVVNVLSDALLCLRLGRMKESVRAFLEILDDKPVENEVLEPFFAGLEKKHPKAGRIRFAYGCSLIYAQQYDKAMSRLILGVKMEPRIADEAMERLRALTEKFETPPESLRDGLVEILLAKGDVLRAAELLREDLAANPEKARRVLELMQPYVTDDAESLVLHYLYMDAALLAEQTKRVLEMLRRLRQNDGHRDDVYQWLEKKSSEQFLPAGVMLLHGEMAAEAGDVDRTIEIFKAVLAASPGDLQVVLAVVEKHKSSDPKLSEFFDEQVKEQRANAPASSDHGLEFEHFENNEFKFNAGSKGELEIENQDGGAASGPFGKEKQTVKPVELDPGPFAGEKSILGDKAEEAGGNESVPGEIETGQKKSPLEAGLELAAMNAVKKDTSEFVWEEEDANGELDPAPGEAGKEDDSWLELQSDKVMHATVEGPVAEEPADEEPADEEPADEEPADEEPADEEPADEEPADGEPAAEEPAIVEPEYDITEDHVLQLAESLRDAGARLFFHVEEEAPQPQPQPAAKIESEPEIETEPEAEPESDAEDKPALEPMDLDVDVERPGGGSSFDGRYQRFLDGRLENEDILTLIDEAIAKGRSEEARTLLQAVQENLSEDAPAGDIDESEEQGDEQTTPKRGSAALVLEKTTSLQDD